MFRLWVLALSLFIFAGVSTAQAGSISIGPPSSYDERQKAEFWLGAIGYLLRSQCGNYSLGKSLVEVARMSPYGQEGVEAFDRFDGYGGNCSRIEKHGEEFAKHLDAYRAYFETAYTCSASGCVERDDKSNDLASLAVDERTLCLKAVRDITADNPRWEDREMYADDVAKAKEHGLTVEACVELYEPL